MKVIISEVMLKITIAVYFFVLLGLIIIVDTPVPVRILAYSLLYIPSLFASVMLYWFYDSFPEHRYTILTSAAKFVVVWHMIFSTAVTLNKQFVQYGKQILKNT